MADEAAAKGDGDQSDSADTSDREFWLTEIRTASGVFQEYWETCRKLIERYRDERKTEGRAEKRMNIFWSNVQTLQPSIYSQMPKPNYSRDFPDKNPVGRVAALISERATWAEMRRMEWDNALMRSRDDYLICGRGQAWVCYRPEHGEAPSPPEPVKAVRDPVSDRTIFRTQSGQEVDPKAVKAVPGGLMASAGKVRIVKNYYTAVEHVAFDEYLHEPVPDWAKCDWVARKHLMRRRELRERFGDEIAGETKLTVTIGGDDRKKAKRSGGTKPNASVVWEIWCKSLRQQIFVSEDYEKGLLDKQDDPLRLERFFPCPRPIYATLTTDSCIPRPDFCLYQDQADLLDNLTRRIDLVVRAIRVAGVYNKQIGGLAKLVMDAAENEMIPVDNWVTLANGGGLKGQMEFLPLEDLMQAMQVAINARNQMRQDIYEVSGISDIVRGQSNAQETATAQQIKGNFATMRLSARQSEMARFCRDLCRIIGEIQAEHYDAETLKSMSGVGYTDDAKFADQALQILKDEKLREVTIDMETDATVQPDQKAEQQSRVEFLSAVAPFLEKAAILGQQSPHMAPVLGELLLFGVRGFRAGRSVEGQIEALIGEMKTALASGQAGAGQQQQDPEAAANAAKMQLQVQTMQQKMELDARQAQHDANLKQGQMALMQLDMAIKKADAAAKEAERQQQAQAAMLETQVAQAQAQAAIAKAQAEIVKADAEKAVAEANKQRAQIDVESANASLQQQRTRAAMDMNNAALDRTMRRQKHDVELKGKMDERDLAAELDEVDAPIDVLPDHVFAPRPEKPKELSPSDKVLAQLAEAIVLLSKPKTVIRGADGRIEGVA